MNWSDVLADPSLQDLPYKIELNEYGAIVMTPASNRHARLQAEIAHHLLLASVSGHVLTECSVETDKGTKVADVAWLSDTFFQTHGETTPYPKAPELCVEIVSRSNSQKEMQEKRALYFARGALEVWLCKEVGTLEFFTPAGPLENSLLFPEFPTTVI